MAAHEFRDDDDNYLDWLAGHPDGYLINILRSHNPTGAKVHRVSCQTINGVPSRGDTWTGTYVKVCADHLADLDLWAVDHVGKSITPCGICHPAGLVVQPTSRKKSTKKTTVTESTGHFVIDGPTPDSAVVQVWADDYIRFEHLPAWQKNLRDEIRTRSRQLDPSAGEVLHATFSGAKLPNADVENLVLYNIDTFPVAGRNGIRFEHGDSMPPAPDGNEYRFYYRYALAPRADALTHWRKGRTLASFGWINLGAFKSEKQLAQVWLALWRGEAKPFFPVTAPNTPFGVRIEVRPPRRHQRRPVWGGWVKGLVDGVICAFQTHTDTTVLPEAVTRLAKFLPAQPEEIEGYLRDKSRAVLGDRPRLVSPFQSGVKWDPSDHFCVAGKLLAAESESADEGWAIKGEIYELSR